MKIRLVFFTSLILFLASSLQTDPRQKREQLYRLNNLGVALMEQYKHEDAAKKFKEALAQDSKFAVARINLAMAYLFLSDFPNSLTESREAVKLAPENPYALYLLANALRNEKQYDESIAAFQKVLAIDPRDPATNIQIGQIYALKQQYEPAIAAFMKAIEAEPYNATAVYSLAQAYNRSGKTADGGKQLQLFQKLRASGYATTLGPTYGEKGRYAEAVVSTGVEPDLVSTQEPDVKFVIADMGVDVKTANRPLGSVLALKLNKAEFNDQKRNELIAPFGSSVTAGDYDRDNRPDLLISGVDAAGKAFLRLLHNEGGKFSDATDRAKLSTGAPVSGGVFGDFDNDGKTDLAVFGYKTLALWKNNGDGSFTDVTKSSKLPADYLAWAMTAAWVDADHDGDLDLYVGNFADIGQWPGSGETAVFPDDFAGQENRFFRNNGDGTFVDATAQTGLGGGKNKTTAVVCADFNNQRDIDFVVANYRAPVQLFSNQRDGTFKEVAEQVGLKYSGNTFSIAAGDLNKDNYIDFYFAETDEFAGKPSITPHPAIFLSNGKGGYDQGFQEPIVGRIPFSLAAQIADYDNDGLLDIFCLSQDTLVALRNEGQFALVRWTGLYGAKSGEQLVVNARSFASGDLDGDGAIDVVSLASNGSYLQLRNQGAGKNYAAINLSGKTSNRSAIGAKVELRSGSLRQKLEIYSSSPAPAATGVLFGLGYRTQVDALQLLWPAGILQSELAVKASTRNDIEELDRKGTSCPILYAWDGGRYQFVTDFLGGSAIGMREPGNVWSTPDTNEYIRVTEEQLKARDGRYSILMNNQLEEVIYFDAVKLLAVDHPADVEIYPNERLMPGPPYPAFKIYSTRDVRPPRKAVDDRGRDILALISSIDRRYPDDFENLSFKGYAKEHTVTLDLGETKDAKQTLLLMTAWIDYADSTSNLAASQAGVGLTPPYLQVKNERGEWQTVIPQMGFPAGLPKTMTVDLTGKFLCRDRQVRIVTSMRIYWDQILVDASDGAAPVKVATLDPLSADLRWRGFPREYSPDGRKPLIYDYSLIEPTAPWKAHLGNYTRFGDVRELLLAPDDRYVITRSGDEIQLDFDARRTPALPKGWKRTFLVYADGFGKDMDLNSARPETIGELPYHGMKSYPYSAGDRYPTSKQHTDYLLQYNTRTIADPLQARWQGVKLSQ
jgi:tetratricopeptide (TPR) repeat protein